MAVLLDDLDVLLGSAPDDPRAVYDRSPTATSGTAPCGSAWRATSANNCCCRSSERSSSPDLAPAMLAHATDIPGQQLEGSVLALPLPKGSFDIVVSGWVIETVPAPRTAVAEYLRVINADGYVLYTFCSLSQSWVARFQFPAMSVHQAA